MSNKVIQIKSPCEKAAISSLKIGDVVSISGTILTGRDAFHKFAFKTYIKENKFSDEYNELKNLLNRAFLYHCGPVMKKHTDNWQFIAGGPTTSIREEPYESDIISHFNLNGVIGKGGMGEKTSLALKENTCVYLHATGGAATLTADKIKKVKNVYFLHELGVPEAVWVLEVENFLCTVTMDSHGNSLHKKIKNSSGKIFDNLIKGLK